MVKMSNVRSSARIAEKYKAKSFTEFQKTPVAFSDTSSDEEDYPKSNSQSSTPRKTKLKSPECNSSPPKQSKLDVRNRKTNQKTANTPSLEKLSLISPKKLKPTRKSLFKENEGTKKAEITKESSDDSEDESFENKSVYQCARRALHGTIPTEMPGREKEYEQLKNFIEGHLENQTSGSLYVSGPPGTGKTASLNLLLKDLDVHSLSHVYVNCTAIKSPTVIYSRIIKELNLKPKGKSEKDHLAQINEYLRKKHKPILLVLDEIDQLEIKNQTILYTIFEWPSRKNFQIILIGIANALDLTDRILPRLQSRCELKPNLLHFAPYTKPQIIEIFTSRLKSAGVLDVFSPVAVQMLAGKVAAVSGDVRRALDIGRRVIELADQTRKTGTLKSSENIKETKAVDLNQVLSVLNNVYGTSQNLSDNSEESFPLQQKIIVCSLLLMLNKNRNKDITVGKLHEVYKKVCEKRKIGAVDQAEFIGLCFLIETRGIINVSGKKEPRLNKVVLIWDEQEVNDALKDKQLISEILQDDSCLGKF